MDVMSYAAFGPGGEQMFITAEVRSNQADWTLPGIHSGFAQRLHNQPGPAAGGRFLSRRALGLKRILTAGVFSAQCQPIDRGAPDDSYFLWGNVGSGVNIEVWEFKAASGTVYPTSLDRTGLAMLTMRVNDLSKCRDRCRIPMESRRSVRALFRCTAMHSRRDSPFAARSVN